MTQTAEKIKTGFDFPVEHILIVRPCLLALCIDIHPAANLLSTLLYHARNCTEADKFFSFYRTQAHLVDDMCHQISEKTLHDTAAPTLMLLGYLEVEEHLKCNRYIVNLERVRQGLSLYKPSLEKQPQLEKFLIDSLQLEKFLITWKQTLTKMNSDGQLEVFPIDKKYFLSELEKVLIHVGKTSNCPRGRKRKPREARKAKSQKTENLEIDRDITRERSNGDGANAHRTHASLSSDVEIEARDNVLTVVFDAYDAPDFFQVRELPVVKTWLAQSPQGAIHGNHRPDQYVSTHHYRSNGSGDAPSAAGNAYRATHDELPPEEHAPTKAGGINTPPLSSVGPQSSQPFTSATSAPLEVKPQHVETPENQSVRIGLERDYGGADNARNPGGGEPPTVQDETGSYSHKNSATNPIKQQQNAPRTRKTNAPSTKPAKVETPKPAKPKPEIEITPEGRMVWERWCSIFKHKMALNQSDADAADNFAKEIDPSSESLNDCRKWHYVWNPKWYGKDGTTHGRVTLSDCWKNWSGFISSLEAPEEKTDMDEAKRIAREGPQMAARFSKSALEQVPQYQALPPAPSDWRKKRVAGGNQ